MGIVAWAKAIGEGLSLINNLTDPDKREKAYRLYLNKKAKKALNYAEKTYHYLDENVWTKDMKKTKEYKKYRYYKNIFFQND